MISREDAAGEGISVIVPFYGMELASLERCVEAILGQEDPGGEVELIVVDNHPARVLAGEFRAGVRVVHEPRAGSYAARNTGVRSARGSILAFTDADCRPDRHWLREGLRALRENPEVAYVGGEIVWSFGWEARPGVLELYDSLVHMRQKVYLEEQHFAATANLLVRRFLFEEVGPFDEAHFSSGDGSWGRRVWSMGYGQALCAAAVVHHPARATWGELTRKTRRLRGGELIRAEKAPTLAELWQEVWQDGKWKFRIVRKNRGLFGRWRVYGGFLTVIGLEAVRLREGLRLRWGGKAQR
jgi:glycosyltransferase involved in cell wall biosynthesis